jgi:glutathione peroxidase
MSVYDVQMKSIDGEADFMQQFDGKVTLVVNIVSKLGYTPQCSTFWSFGRTTRQLWQLQKVHDEFKDRGFSVVGFPCNQFGQMEPGENEEISEWVKQTYPFVNFPLSEKIEVNGKGGSLVYSALLGNVTRVKDASPADTSEAAYLGWNKSGGAVARIPHSWEKFVVSRSGEMITRFNWQSDPLDDVPLTTGESWTIRECIDEVLDY